MFNAYVDLYQAQGNHEAAKAWLQMWARIDPESPEVERRQAALELDDRLKSLQQRWRV